MTQYQTDRLQMLAEVRKNWLVTYEAKMPPVHVAQAEANTSSRYLVVSTELPGAGVSIVGNQVLVSVLQPWQAVWTARLGDVLSLGYVEERWSGGVPRYTPDIAALAMTVAYVLQGRVIWP